MDNTQALQGQIDALFQSQQLAVLATQSGGQPYTSLVAFSASSDLKNLYFVTPRNTRKFNNIVSDSRVSLLIDNSSNQTTDFHRAMAVTAVGHATEIDMAGAPQQTAQYLLRHPHLREFVDAPTTALVRVAVRSYYLVQQFQNVTELHFSS